MRLESAIEAHYQERFGKPDREAEFQPREGSPIRIWKWNTSSTSEGVALYATLGATSWLTGDEHRCEFFLGLNPERDDVAEGLAEAALKGSGRGTPPQPGDTLTLTQPLWTGTEMCTFLFSRGEEILPALELPRPVTFMQLVPLHPEELAFKKEFCEHDLWKEFEKRTVPFWDPRRPPIF
jgi:suppressor of fused protein SUFU